ncbi:hypothetical protein SAY86_024602 [Trapa natans]|uniref:Uncharacterized protein n=1 Tax=Trapa natans TaxID=22666 RepID=A0AAN7MHM6_TRANT|nr:hypothetical protein SAY86_024602 [Trapa natans]
MVIWYRYFLTRIVLQKQKWWDIKVSCTPKTQRGAQSSFSERLFCGPRQRVALTFVVSMKRQPTFTAL